MGVGDDVAPRFTQKPALRQEDNGQKLVFHCVLEASPKPDIAWFMGTTPLQNTDRTRMRTEPAGGSAFNVILEILGVAQSDAGTYKVVAKNRLGEVSASINLNFSAGGQKQQEGIAPNFIQKPVTRQENNGKKLLFECALTADPAPAITWYKDNAVIQPSDRFIIRAEPRENKTYFLVLEINDVAAQDAGNYKVTAKNTLGESNATIRLNFDSSKKPQGQDGKAPHFTQKPTIKQQQNLLLMTCLLEAKPTPQIRWFRDTTEIGDGGRYSITLQRDASGADLYTAVLQIKDPATEDAGTYKCTAANDLGESNANITLNFQGGEKPGKPPGGIAPTFKEKPKVAQDPSGKNIVIECQCTANPKPVITWYKGTSVLTASTRVVPTIVENGNEYTLKLEIFNFTKDDGGQYKVTAKNDIGEGNANITINLEPPKEPPPVLQGKPNIRLDEPNQMIIIEQGVQSSVVPQVTWYYGNQPLKADGRYRIEFPQEKGIYYPTLQITNFSEKDSGTYKLVVKTNGGEVTSTATVNVSALKPKVKGEAPKFIQQLAPKNVNDGDKVEFVAKVSGTEPIEVLWAKDKKPLKSGDIFVISYDKGTAKLSISEVFPEDSGIYSIEIKNQWGSASSSASLKVKELPEEKLQNDQNKNKDASKVEIKSQLEESKMEIRTQSKAKQETPPVEEIMEVQKVVPKEEAPPPKKPEEKKPEEKKPEEKKPAPKKVEEPKKVEPPKKVEEPKKPEEKKPEPKIQEEKIKPVEEPSKSATPSIVVDEDDKGRVGKQNKGVRNLRKGKPHKVDADTEDDNGSKSRNPKTKGGKPYVKQPTTILEELEEGYFKGFVGNSNHTTNSEDKNGHKVPATQRANQVIKTKLKT